jgi:hypothetical protein
MLVLKRNLIEINKNNSERVLIEYYLNPFQESSDIVSLTQVCKTDTVRFHSTH